MFRSRTLWVSDWYLWTSRSPKDMHIFRAPESWKWQIRRNAYCSSQKNEVCTGGILLYQFTIFLNLAKSCGWIQQKHQIIIFELAVPSQPWCDSLFETRGATHCFLQHLLVWLIVFYNTSNSIKTQLIIWKQRPRIQSWISKLCFLISRNC